jgi:hypothetical protein
MKRVSRLFLSLTGLVFAGGLLLALGAHVRGTNAEPVLSDPPPLSRPRVQSAAFGDEVIIGSAGVTMCALATGDLDRDGSVDLVSSGLLAWQNPGTGALSSTWVSSTVEAIVDVRDAALGDLDQDGDLDVVAVGRFGVALWQNPWDGGSGMPFASWPVSHVLTTTTTGLVDEVVVADLDHDGWLDVAAARGYSTSEGWLCVWQNPGTFAGSWTLNVLTDTLGFQSLAAADLDHDGWIDLVSGTGDYALAQEVRAWRNDGTPFAGTWPSSQVVELWFGLGADDANGIALADLDRDGWLDVVVDFEDHTWGKMGVWRNPGTPFAASWTVSVTMNASSRVGSVAAADWDRDGDVDIVSVPDVGGNDVLWWENDGSPFSGEWSWERDWGASVDARSVLLADLDRDGDLDTVVSGENAIVAWPNDLAPHEWPLDNARIDVGDTDREVRAVAAGDLDWDGDLDLVSDGLYAWEHPYPDTSSAPWPSATLEAGATANDIALADLDHDGDLDAVGGGKFGVAIWENPRDGGASTPFGSWPVSHVLTTAQIGVNEVVVADLDRDGWQDVAAVRGHHSYYGWLCAWQNPHALGDAWASNVITNAPALFLSVAAADLDRDGWIDLATGSVSSFGVPVSEVRAWRNDGTPFAGGWDSNRVVDLKSDLGGDNANALSIVDLDRDGWLDIAAGYEKDMWGYVGVWRNLGTPFSTGWPVSVTMEAHWVSALAGGDLDHDGDADLVSAGFSGGEMAVTWWENDGSPFDAPWTSLRAWATGTGLYDLLLADLTKQGDLDVIVSGQGSSTIAAWLSLWEHIYLPLVTKNHVTYFAGPWEVEPNDSPSEANGPLIAGQDYYGQTDDAEDHYSLYLRSSGQISVSLTTAITQGLQLSLLYGSPANQVEWDNSAPYSLEYGGTAGWYYVRVYADGTVTATVPYTLQVTHP